MSNLEDPRAPQGREQPNPPHPGEAGYPTENIGRPDEQAQQYRGGDPTAAYPTQQYHPDPQQYQDQQFYPDPRYQFPPQSDVPANPPGYHPTQALPTYEAEQQYAYGDTRGYGYPQQGQGPPPGQDPYGQDPYGQDPYGQPPNGPGPVGDDRTEGGGPPKWLLALLALVVLAVVVVAGIALLGGNSSDDDNSAAAPPATTLQPTTAPAPVQPSPESSAPGSTTDLLPGGIPEILGQLGSSVGTVTANDGTTVTIDGLDGAPVTIETTPQTQIISLGGRDVADLEVGSFLVVRGEQVQDGTIRADVIIETPGLGG